MFPIYDSAMQKVLEIKNIFVAQNQNHKFLIEMVLRVPTTYVLVENYLDACI